MERLLVARQRWALLRLALGDFDAVSNRFRLDLNETADENLRLHALILEAGLARCTLERNDLALAVKHLERVKPLQHLAYQHDQRDLELTHATLQFRLGETQPTLEATAQPDEVLTLRARSLTLRIEVLQAMNAPLLEEIAQAQSWLEATEVPALEGLELRRVLARVLEGLGQIEVVLGMRKAYRQTVNQLASTLETCPELQRSFLEKFLEPT